MLHDTVEDTDLTLEDIRKEIGDRNTTLVDHCTEDKTLSWEDFHKSLMPLVIRLLLASSTIVLPGLLLALMTIIGLQQVAQFALVQFLLFLLGLGCTILLNVSFVDHYLDLGLKDALLIVLSPYYLLILVSFFLS